MLDSACYLYANKTMNNQLWRFMPKLYSRFVFIKHKIVLIFDTGLFALISNGVEVLSFDVQ